MKKILFILLFMSSNVFAMTSYDLSIMNFETRERADKTFTFTPSEDIQFVTVSVGSFSCVLDIDTGNTEDTLSFISLTVEDSNDSEFLAFISTDFNELSSVTAGKTVNSFPKISCKLQKSK